MLTHLVSCCTKARAAAAAGAVAISLPLGAFAAPASSSAAGMKKLSIEKTDLKGKRVVRAPGPASSLPAHGAHPPPPLARAAQPPCPTASLPTPSPPPHFPLPFRRR